MKAAIEDVWNKEMGRYKVSGIFIIFLLPHSNHKIQPLDKSFIAPPLENILLPRY